MQPEGAGPREKLIAFLIVLAWYLFFTWKSAGRYFDNDDMMNLYFAWSRHLTEVYRPIGALFYRWMFAAAGFNPVPFRIACLAIGAMNIALCWRFVSLVSGSSRVAALAALLFAFQSRLMEVWFRTAVIYDLLCFTFFYLAVCLYVEARRRDQLPGGARSAAILILFGLALGSKEVAVVLPVILLAYELLFRGAAWPPLWRISVLALIDVPYLYFKTHGAGALASIPDYRPEFTFGRFSESWALYLKYLFVLQHDLSPWIGWAVAGGLLVLAMVLGSRQLIFAWTVLFTATLPVAFLPSRGGYVLYTAYAGWVFYAAILLSGWQGRFAPWTPARRAAVFWSVFVLAGWWWGKRNLHDQRIDARPWLYDSARQVRELAGQMRAMAPRLPPRTRVLFLQDAFATDEWTPYFEMKLLYGDDSMVVDRWKMMDRKPDGWASYDQVFTYEDGRYRRVK